MKIELKIDLSTLTDAEVTMLKYVAVKQQAYCNAAILRDYEKHIEAINKLNLTNQ